MRRSWKILGNTITPDDEAATTGEAQRGAEGAGFPPAMYTAKLRGAPPHGDQGQDTEAHKRYSRHKWQGNTTGVGQLRRHARGSTRRWACGCARRGSRHLSASGDVNACRHLGMDRALVSVGLARVIVLERERVSVTRL